MFEPKFLIRLDEKMFSEDRMVCLGSQLKNIVCNIRELIEPHIWFGADIDAISLIPKKIGINSFKLRGIGGSNSLINLCENIDQFLSGIFIAVKEKNRDLKCLGLRLETEDMPFRSINLEGILIEIRTFDTSYFELYSDDAGLMKRLSEMYKTDTVLFSPSQKNV